jgi:hypothetical protein
MTKPIQGVYQVLIENICDDLDHSEVDEAKVDEITASMGMSGLLSPISVTPYK